VGGVNNQTLSDQDNDELMEFRKDVAELTRQINGSGKLMGEANKKIEIIEHAIRNYPGADINLLKDIEDLKLTMIDCRVMLYGDWIRSRHEFETKPGISSRIGRVSSQIYANTTGVTNTQRENKKIAEAEYEEFRKKLDTALIRLKGVEKKLEDANIPYTINKDENWKED
jgi:hypothetical protein